MCICKARYVMCDSWACPARSTAFEPPMHGRLEQSAGLQSVNCLRGTDVTEARTPQLLSSYEHVIEAAEKCSLLGGELTVLQIMSTHRPCISSPGPLLGSSSGALLGSLISFDDPMHEHQLR